jgi:hypothetical protein
MPRKIAITASQVTALCKGAANAGFIPEIMIGDVIIRLVPERLATVFSASNALSEDELDQELRAFEALDRQVLPWTGPHLNHREEKVLRVLVAAEGRPLAANAIHLAGLQTVNGLLAYGLVGLEEGAEIFDRRHHCIYATEEGLSFFSKRKAHYRRHPTL